MGEKAGTNLPSPNSNFKKVFYTAAGEHSPTLESLAENTRGESRLTPRVLELGVPRI